jgi:NADH-quinone oxidoreductase subunit H
MPLPETLNWITAQLLVSCLVVAVMLHVILITVAYLIYLERKISAYVQDRVGPNRVGLDFGLTFMPKFLRRAFGLGQSLADGFKLFLKEDYAPSRVDKALFTLAPAIIVIPALMGFLIIPWGGTWMCPDIHVPLTNYVIAGGPVQVIGANINVGVVYLLAVAAMGVYGVTLGGWASNNKYSFLGGLRATSQMISYEIPMGMALLAVLLTAGSVLPDTLVRIQALDGWNILLHPLAGILFFIAGLAEANRAPFDNAECEQELVGGYHTEYSSMRFGTFLLAEYAHVQTFSSFFTLLFLGGYHLPFVPGLSPEATGLGAMLLKCGVYFTKVILVISLVMLVRWSLPRLRFDQIMQTAWQALIPLGLLVIVGTSVMIYLNQRTLIPMLGMNVFVAVIFVLLMPWLHTPRANARVPLYGSRFSPMAGERVSHAPTSGLATEDRPVEGTLPLHS